MTESAVCGPARTSAAAWIGEPITHYRPYGLTRKGSTLSGKTDYGYTDQEFDDSTGLYNYDARLYNPDLGMFITADSVLQDIYDPQLLNRYAYARDNPINYVDPDGHGVEAIAEGIRRTGSGGRS